MPPILYGVIALGRCAVTFALALVDCAPRAVLVMSVFVHEDVLKGVGEEKCAAGAGLVWSRLTVLTFALSHDITVPVLPARVAVDWSIVVGGSLW